MHRNLFLNFEYRNFERLKRVKIKQLIKNITSQVTIIFFSTFLFYDNVRKTNPKSGHNSKLSLYLTKSLFRQQERHKMMDVFGIGTMATNVGKKDLPGFHTSTSPRCSTTATTTMSPPVAVSSSSSSSRNTSTSRRGLLRHSSLWYSTKKYHRLLEDDKLHHQQQEEQSPLPISTTSAMPTEESSSTSSLIKRNGSEPKNTIAYPRRSQRTRHQHQDRHIRWNERVRVRRFEKISPDLIPHCYYSEEELHKFYREYAIQEEMLEASSISSSSSSKE